MKPKKCKNCGDVFTPTKRIQPDCSPKCEAERKAITKKKTRAKPKKKKRKSPAQEAEAVAKRLQLLVRLKAADDNGYASCVTCGKVEHYKDLQGGHFISRVKSIHKLEEWNIHPQCKQCNGPLRGNIDSYTLWMIDYYGRDFVEDVIARKNDGKKWDRQELAEQLEEIEEQIKYHKERVGE